MINVLMFLKEKCPKCWIIIEWLNGFLFRIIYSKRFSINIHKTLNKFSSNSFHCRILNTNDIVELSNFLNTFDQTEVKTFEPHDFDTKTLRRINKNPSFYMFGVFEKKILIGYFFLRCFLNRKAFMGRIVAITHRNKGIAKKMAQILHQIAWQSKFRIFSTIDPENIASLKSQAAVCNYNVLRTVSNGYFLIEYEQKNAKQESNFLNN